MKLPSIAPDCVVFHLQAANPVEAIQLLVQAAHVAGMVADPQNLLENVLEREAYRDTGGCFPDIAVPRGSSKGTSCLTLVIGVLETPLIWHARHSEPVSHVILLAVPAVRRRATILQSLVTIGKSLDRPERREKLIQAASVADLVDIANEIFDGEAV